MIWEVAAPDSQLQERLAHGLGISPIVAGLLINRGLRAVDEARVFLKPRLEDLHDPFLMKGMEQAVDRIKKALVKREKILIYGDYDVDGLTATTLLTFSLRSMGGNVCSYIPHRVKEGYGLNKEAIKVAYEDGVGLILTVDCGTNSIHEVIEAKRLGIDTIITDHHEPESVALPPAVAVINPHQPDCSYPCNELSGVGIAFKLLHALGGFREEGEHLDLVVLGTVADVVPLKGENRIIVKYGLEKLGKTRNAGLRALMQVSGVSNGKPNAEQVAFILAPRLNAPGRLNSAEMSLRLLTVESEKEALELAHELEKDNRRRQVIQNKILEDAHEKVEKQLKEKSFPVIVLADESWHPGVVGIVASRLVEDYYRPAILIAMDKEKGKGSARSIEQFHILYALRECKGLLKSFGGHSQAAGLVIERKNIGNFCEKMEKIGEARLAGKDLLPKLGVDMELNLSKITGELIEELSCLEPYGSGNTEPRFLSRGVQVMSPRVVKNKHLKMGVLEKGRRVDVIGFGMGDYIGRLTGGQRADIVYSPQINTWGGVSEIQLRLSDIRVV